MQMEMICCYITQIDKGRYILSTLDRPLLSIKTINSCIQKLKNNKKKTLFLL